MSSAADRLARSRAALVAAMRPPAPERSHSPWPLLALAALAGAVFLFARPWRLARGAALLPLPLLLRTGVGAALRALDLPALAMALFRLRRSVRARRAPEPVHRP